jgi:ubiquinone/menaquinone biosynthesis C-methylase UbiE
MPMIAYILAGVAALAAVGWVVWRVASSRHSLPCPAWLRWMVELDNPFTKTNRAAVIVEHLQLQPGMAVADIGCGPGRLAVPVARAVGPSGRVVAVDVQTGMLDRARAKAAAADVSNIEFVEAAVGSGALQREAFDRVLLVTVLGEIPDQAACLAEAFAALRPGGVLSVTEVIFDPHFQRQSRVARAAEAAGFRRRAVFGNRIAYTMHLEKPVDV